jgi:nucleoside 2-deoxyribosyltransferase
VACGKFKGVKVYVAAPYVHKVYAKGVADTLRENGFEVTAHWVDRENDSNDTAVLRAEALQDWTDVRAADALLLLNLGKSEGKATEQGFALELSKPIIAVGKPSQVFHHLPQYTWVETVGKAMEALEEIGVHG